MPLECKVLLRTPAETRQERLRTFRLMQATQALKEVARSTGPASVTWQSRLHTYTAECLKITG
jgi:hypothetical protein